jgi:hypothetical protein
MFRLKSMQDKKSRLVKRFIVITLVTCFLFALLATTNAFASIPGQKPKDSFTTTVTGVGTNVIATPVTINCHSFTKNNIHDYPLQFSDDGTVSICASNFLPGDYVQFTVTITNTGTETLAFQPFSYCCYFVDKCGNLISPPYSAPISGYPAPINHQGDWSLACFGTDTLGTYLTYLDGSRSTNWLIDFSYTAAATLPKTLAPGATFTYNLFLGLGTNVPYGIPGYCLKLNIPLASASTVPTPSASPTPTPKPTACPTPTHTPCPTATPKPTPTCSPTPTPKPTSTPTPTPKPTCPPTPTHTPCPTPTPKPTACPTPTHAPCPTPTPKSTPTPTPTHRPK